MSGTWEKQNKVIPGAYINVRTNEPLRIIVSILFALPGPK